MASGDTLIHLDPRETTSPAWLYVPFNSGGTTTPAKGDTIWGDTSNANGVLELVVLLSGTWAGGDAAGWMFLSNWNGTTWNAGGENFGINTTAVSNHGTFTAAPVNAFAQLDEVRSDTPILAFDATTNECAAFNCFMPDAYAGGGLTITGGVVSATATGDMSFGIALKSFTDDAAGDNLSAVGTDPSGLKVYAEPNYNTAVDAASVAGEIKYFTITFSDGPDMDSIAAGEFFQLLLFRDAQDSTNDDMAADAKVVFLVVSES